jgi:hypothetical protein
MMAVSSGELPTVSPDTRSKDISDPMTQLSFKRYREVVDQETVAQNDEAIPSKRFNSAPPGCLQGHLGHSNSAVVEEKGWMFDYGD